MTIKLIALSHATILQTQSHILGCDAVALDASGLLGNLPELLHLSDNIVHFFNTCRKLNVKQ